MKISAMIVDDEPLAVAELQAMLQAFPEIDIAGSAADADEALRLIAAKKPDLLFLDIQMPGKNGFELLENLDHAPYTVFVTAYDQFALNAFDVSALDYLLKPVNAGRLAEAVQKVKRLLQPSDSHEKKLDANKRIFIKDGEKCFFVPLSDIRLIESVGNYARVCFENHQPLLHKSLNYLEERLPPELFFRANRQVIFNIGFVANIFPYFNHSLQVELTDGTKVDISQRQSVKFKEVMGI